MGRGVTLGGIRCERCLSVLIIFSDNFLRIFLSSVCIILLYRYVPTLDVPFG